MSFRPTAVESVLIKHYAGKLPVKPVTEDNIKQWWEHLQEEEIAGTGRFQSRDSKQAYSIASSLPLQLENIIKTLLSATTRTEVCKSFTNISGFGILSSLHLTNLCGQIHGFSWKTDDTTEL